MSDNLFDGARFGDRFLTKGGYVVIYQRRIECVRHTGVGWSDRKEYTLHNVMTDDKVYCVHDDGTLEDDADLFDSYTIVSKVVDDEDFIDAIAVKECPFDEYEYGDSYYADDYKAAFKDGFKKALNVMF